MRSNPVIQFAGKFRHRISAFPSAPRKPY